MANNDNNDRGGIWGILIVSIISIVMVVIVLAWATAGWKNWDPEKWFNSWGVVQPDTDDEQDGETPHKHTFDTTKWLSDSKNHWHASTCVHDIVINLAAHTFKGDKCAVCGYVKPTEPAPHKHTFDNAKWESDEKNHWHPSTCGHNIVKDIAPHNYKDGACTVCGSKELTEPDPHKHTFDTTKWESDSRNHWHPSTCGHNIVANMAAHTYEDGICTVCGHNRN